MVLAPDTQLGPYRIVSFVGAGGMGEVYRATDQRLERVVAIKTLAPSTTAGPDAIRRFEQEARAAAALNHPNILAVYDVGTLDGVPYIVSELLEGQTLRQCLDGRACDQLPAAPVSSPCATCLRMDAR
jgi:eukaryotic-like serine/threonine-protein kinase